MKDGFMDRPICICIDDLVIQKASIYLDVYVYMLYVYIYWSRREYSPLVLYCDTYQMDSIDIDTWA